eukprot:363008_1
MSQSQQSQSRPPSQIILSDEAEEDWKLPTNFVNDADTWRQFRNFVLKGLKMRTNNWGLSWRTKYDYLKILLKTARDNTGNAIVVNQDAPEEYKKFIGTYVCKGCYELVKREGREKLKTFLGNENGFFEIKNVKSFRIQSPSLVTHTKSKLHKLAYGLLISIEDKNVWRMIYASAIFNIPFRTHPFLMYLGTVSGGQYGNQLHGISFATRCTIVLGSLIRSTMWKFVNLSPWKSFGLDTGDGIDATKLLYFFIRVVSLGQPINLFGGVRRELGAKGCELFQMYQDFITGNDMEWGYDLEIKLKKDFFESKNMNVDDGDDIDEYDEENVTNWNEPSYITLAKTMKDNDIQFGINFEKTVEETSSVCTDAAANFYGTGEGYEGHRFRNEKQIMDAKGKETRTLRNHCVNHKIDLDAHRKNTDAEILNDTQNLVNSIRRFWEVTYRYKILMGTVYSFGMKLKSVFKELELRWLRFISDSLSTAAYMIDVWIISCIKILESDAYDEETFEMLQLLLNNYYTILLCNETIGVYAALNNYAEYEAKTVIDWVDQVDTTLEKMKRIKEGGIISSIAIRIRPVNNNLNQYTITSNKLQWIVDKLYELNNGECERVNGDLEFDALDITSYVNDTLLTYYIENYKTDHINCIMYKLVDAVCKYEPDINEEKICNEYENTIRDIYLHYESGDITNLEYYELWCGKMNDSQWKQQNPNLFSFTYLIWVIIFSNSKVEKIVHVSNLYRNKKRNGLAMLVLDSLLQIFYNGQCIVQCDKLLELGIDLWYRMGGLGALGEFSATDIPVAMRHVEQYYQRSSKTNLTDFSKRKKRRDIQAKQNNEIMKISYS